ncbi:tRNA (adenosine(37)-N6)-dimethylallyltransferase MiaA [Ructibacterium gallinarum]|uniref:tRNA dimethylallyltransferase n=1 Tax=Ructibacterium gallinarum TaxID=2779355 RepID=A0A9D5M5T3_9FIRM|nr:tRNA (adenosine(37)-N6)-dimethylallyltransferase MiaA [Ructibacterium gallinarum]MBE5040099.1 tRNA (adenosine(37)-N6)-dimethylallyltransferase MiaA [Ructibacterium gallinarum]
MEKPEIVCVVGPTASGKTEYAINLAKKYNGEVVSCDSMQIYRYMDIGTAKPTQEEMQNIPHHMIDFVDPREDYSVADFVRDARVCINDILERKKLPVLCGGTGLYVDSILNQIEFSEEKKDEKYRHQLQELAQVKGNDAVYALLLEQDPKAAEAIHPHNLKRVIRALEIIKTTGMTKEEADKKARKEPVYQATIYGMQMEREKLYQRINLRVDQMMDRGLLDEVRRLLEMGVSRKSTAMQAIGYKELAEYFDGFCSLEEAVDSIKRESRRYAKRQMTWFRRNSDIIWIQR